MKDFIEAIGCILFLGMIVIGYEIVRTGIKNFFK